MACIASVRGHQGQGSHGHGKKPSQTHEGHQANSNAGRDRGQKYTAHIISDDATAYHEGSSSQVRRLIVESEVNLNQKVVKTEIDLDD